MLLHTDWTFTTDHLRVAYRLTNNCAAPLYAYTIPRTAARLLPRPGCAYTLLTSDDTELTLLLGTCQPPERYSVPLRVQPLAVLVPPGKQYAGEVKVPIPLVEWNAYSSPDAQADTVRPVDVYLLQFVVEYVLEGETYFRQQNADGNWDVGGTVVRVASATHVPDNPVRVLSKWAHS